MYRKCIGSDPTAARLDFALYEVAGEWESRSGSPRVRIYRNPGRREVLQLSAYGDYYRASE